MGYSSKFEMMEGIRENGFLFCVILSFFVEHIAIYFL